MFWLHFPAILKGWFERVFRYGEAYALTPEGWRSELKSRVPRLEHEQALVRHHDPGIRRSRSRPCELGDRLEIGLGY